MPDTLDADARWAAAAKLADGMVDDRLSRRRRWALTWISALIIGSMLLGLVLGLWLLSHTEGGSTDEGRTTSRLVLQGIFLVLGLAVGIGGFIWAPRTGRYITRWRAVISPLNLAEKKSVRRQLAGKLPADEERLPVLLAIARQNQRVTQGIAPIYAALVLLNVSQSFSAPDFLKYLVLGAAAAFILIGAQLAVAYRRTDTFIETHSSPLPS